MYITKGNQTVATKAIPQEGILRKTAICSFLVAIISLGNLWCSEAPSLSFSGENERETSSSAALTFTASGGSTEEPSEDKGCAPWTKTGNKQYLWKVEIIEDVDGESPSTSPGNGETSTSPKLTMNFDKPGKIKITVGLQEEYKDSSSTPIKLYWPE